MTNIYKSETYRIGLSEGVDFMLTRSLTNSFIEIGVEWANGERMESFSELNIRPEDIQKLADIFADMAKAVDA